jgi:hypothetical protein
VVGVVVVLLFPGREVVLWRRRGPPEEGSVVVVVVVVVVVGEEERGSSAPNSAPMGELTPNCRRLLALYGRGRSRWILKRSVLVMTVYSLV